MDNGKMRTRILSCVATVALATVFAAPGSLAAPLLYDVVAGHDTASGPPYPTDAIDFSVGTAASPPSPMSPTLKLRLDGAHQSDPPAPDVPYDLAGAVGRIPGGAGGAGLEAIIGFSLQEPPEPDKPVLIIPCVDILLPGGAMATLLLPGAPTLAADHKSIDVSFSALLGDGSVFIQRIAFAILAGQDFTFDAPTAVIGNSVDMSFALTFARGGSYEPGQSVFTATITGDQVAEPATLSLALVGLLGLAGMGRRRAA